MTASDDIKQSAREQAGAVSDTSRQAASDVASSAQDATRSVVSTASEQAGQVAGEASAQFRRLAGETTDQLRTQANSQSQRLADGLRSAGDELHTMANASETGGPAADLVREAADRAHRAASYLQERDPDQLLDDVRRFARRRPGLFLAGAAAAGFVTGRLIRANSGSSTRSTPDYARYPTTPVTGMETTSDYTVGAVPPPGATATGTLGAATVEPLTSDLPASDLPAYPAYPEAPESTGTGVRSIDPVGTGIEEPRR